MRSKRSADELATLLKKPKLTTANDEQTQSIVTAITAVAILHIRSAHSLWFGVGTLVAALTAKLLKHFIRQPRPTASAKVTYGMPSTHSSSIAFFGTYLALCMLMLPIHPRVSAILPGYGLIHSVEALALAFEQGGAAQQAVRTTWQERRRGRGWKDAVGEGTRASFAMLVLATAGAVMWSRVRLGHHTRAQVIAGASLGTLVAVGWFFAWIGFEPPTAATQYVPDRWLQDEGSTAVAGLKGTGGLVERAAEDAVFTLLEAWQLRDYRIAWDGVARPALHGLQAFVGAGSRSGEL